MTTKYLLCFIGLTLSSGVAFAFYSMYKSVPEDKRDLDLLVLGILLGGFSSVIAFFMPSLIYQLFTIGLPSVVEANPNIFVKK